MPHREKKSKKSDKKTGVGDQSRSNQFAAQRRMDMNTRSILTRFQNRKSEKK